MCASCNKPNCSCSSQPTNCKNLTEDIQYNGTAFECVSDTKTSITSGMTLSAILLSIYQKLCSLTASVLGLQTSVSAIIAGHIIEDEGVPLVQRGTLNFVGNGILVTDDGTKTVVTINAGTGGVGPEGQAYRFGAGVPSGALGVNGDTYIDLTSTDINVYTKAADAWSDSGVNLKGAIGVAGTNGTNGINGTNGAAGVNGLNVYQSAAAPLVSSGVDGESHIDSVTGNLWFKVAGVWGITGNLYSGAITGFEDLFAAQSTVIQGIVGNNFSQLVFSNDSAGGNFDYTNSWITNTWTASDTRTNISFGCVISLEVNGVNASFNNNVNFLIKKNGLVILNEPILVPAGTINGTIINQTFNTIATNFVLGDIVTCEISTVGLGANYATFSGEAQIGSLFYNVQL